MFAEEDKNKMKLGNNKFQKMTPREIKEMCLNAKIQSAQIMGSQSTKTLNNQHIEKYSPEPHNRQRHPDMSRKNN